MITLGIDVHDSILDATPQRRRALLERAAIGGLDHVCVGDHVSFHDGAGFDGMVSATAALASHDHLKVWIAVYQLALRHPTAVARQLASLAQIGPGRITLGVGVGGEDRTEVRNCGIDPATRGQRLDECLQVLAKLAAGNAIDHSGAFFELEQARVIPPPSPSIPIVIGGNSESAVRRTARYGDGWLGIFTSARRFAEIVDRVRDAANTVDRDVKWFGLQVWCGLDPRPGIGRELLSQKMEELYHVPYERFERVAPAGNPTQIAEWLQPFIDAGAEHITLLAAAENWEAGIDQAVEVRAILAEAATSSVARISGGSP
jgi:alkanesulfonate monooxygenase SsuD/methylene tetrahydromethanopterin reductase-like flavin-dependent oxidoreductase (luciferase family)